MDTLRNSGGGSWAQATLLAALALPAALGAQAGAAPPAGASPAGTFGERLDVEVVNVEVYVSSRDGGSVTGLRPEDFRIFEDGDEVELTHFSYVDLGAAPAAASGPGDDASAPSLGEAPAGEEEGLRLVIFIDDVEAGPSNRIAVLSDIWRLLEDRLQPQDEVMLVQFDGRMKVLLPLSRNRKKLFKAMSEYAELSVKRLQAAHEELRVLEEIHNRQALSMDGASKDEICSPDLGYIAKSYAESVYHRVKTSLSLLTAFVDSLAGIPGRKAVLHVSDGIPLSPGATAYQLAIELCDGTAAAQGDPIGFDVSLMPTHGNTTGRYNRFDPERARHDMLRYDLSDDYRKVAAHASAQRVSFYTLQATGLQGFVGSSAAFQQRMLTMGVESLRIRNKQDSLFILADETGGRAIFNVNDFRPALDRMVDDLRGYYLLGYTPDHRREGKVHHIRVAVDRPGVEVRHRKSYRDKTEHERVADRVLSSLLHGSTFDNPMGLEAVVGPPTPEESDEAEVVPAAHGGKGRKAQREGRTAKVVISLRIPLDSLSLQPHGEGFHSLFTLFLAARDEEGRMTPVRKTSVPLTIPAEEIGGGEAREYVYDIEMTMRDGEHEVSLALLDELAGVTSFLRRSVDVEVR